MTMEPKKEDERCKACTHWTDQRSEFDGWQLCDARRVLKNGDDWCLWFKRISPADERISPMTGLPSLSANK